MQVEPPVVALDMADDLRSITLFVYNESKRGFCLPSEMLYERPWVTYPDGRKVRLGHRRIGRPPEEEYRYCPNYVAPRQTFTYVFKVGDEAPKFRPTEFSICLELEWALVNPDQPDSATSTACSRVQKRVDGTLKVVPQPTRLVRPDRVS